MGTAACSGSNEPTPISLHSLAPVTSERTLLRFLAVGLDRDAIRGYATLFQSGLRRLLESEGFARRDVDRVLDEYQELALAPTTDRSVLGSLNDLARLAAACVQHKGGL